MANGYETFAMRWGDYRIEVSHQANWLSSGQWHIELRCEDQLPITQTGYRSIFVPNAEFADDAQIEAFLVHLLDEAARSKEWLAHLENSRQLTLF